MKKTTAAPFPLTGGDYTWDGEQLTRAPDPAVQLSGPIAPPTDTGVALPSIDLPVTSPEGRRKPRPTDQ